MTVEDDKSISSQQQSSKEDLEANESEDYSEMRAILARNLKNTGNPVMIKHLTPYLRQINASGRVQLRISEN